MPAVDNKVTENLTAKQVAKLLQVLDEEEDIVMASLIRLALFTGMRRSALLNLQWTDLDFERNSIMLRGDVAKKEKDGIYSHERTGKSHFAFCAENDKSLCFSGP